VANKTSDGGRGFVSRNVNAKHRPVITGTSEIAVNSKAFDFVTKHAMHIPVLKLLPCIIHRAINSIKTMSINNSTSQLEPWTLLEPCLDVVELLLQVAQPKFIDGELDTGRLRPHLTYVLTFMLEMISSVCFFAALCPVFSSVYRREWHCIA